MAKLSVLFLLLLNLLSFTVQSQSFERLSVRGGLNFSRLNLNNAVDENIRLGFQTGLVARVRKSNFFAIQPELLYSTMGTRAEFNLPEFNGDATIRLRYVQVPILGVATFFKTVSLQGGPFLSYLVGSNFLAEGTFGNAGRTLTRDDFRDLDLGLAGGLEVHLNTVDIGFRVCRGIINVSGVRPLMAGGNNLSYQLYFSYNLLSIFN
jgi:hypothetical protein